MYESAVVEGKEDDMKRSNPFAAMAQLCPELMGVVFHLAWMFLLLYYDSDSIIKHEVGSTSVDSFYMISLVSLIATALLSIIWLKRFLNLFFNGTGPIIAGLITCLGTIAACLSALNSSIALTVAAGALTGIGSSITASLWATVFSRVTPRQTCINLPVLLALIVFTCTDATFMPAILFYILVVALPLASSACLTKTIESLGAADNTKRNDKSAETEKRVQPKVIMGVLIVALVVIGLLEGALSSMPAHPVLFAVSYEDFYYFIITLIIYAFLGFFIFESRKEDLVPLYLMPCAITIAFILPLICLSPQNTSALFYNIGLMSQELILIAGATAAALNFHLPPIRTFLTARIIFGIADLLGSCACSIFFADAFDETAGIIVFAAGEFIVILLIGVLWLLHQYNANHAEPKVNEENVRNVQIKDSCNALAQKYKLSPRETEVFCLLAEGRSTARIREVLFIAEGTVNTHVRNIYRKLGVHNKQELIDLIYGNEEDGVRR